MALRLGERFNILETVACTHITVRYYWEVLFTRCVCIFFLSLGPPVVHLRAYRYFLSRAVRPISDGRASESRLPRPPDTPRPAPQAFGPRCHVLLFAHLSLAHTTPPRPAPLRRPPDPVRRNPPRPPSAGPAPDSREGSFPTPTVICPHLPPAPRPPPRVLISASSACRPLTLSPGFPLQRDAKRPQPPSAGRSRQRCKHERQCRIRLCRRLAAACERPRP